MRITTIYAGNTPQVVKLKYYNNASSLYIASKVVKELNKNVNIPGEFYLDGDSIGHKMNKHEIQIEQGKL